MAVRNVTDVLEVRLDEDDVVEFVVNGIPTDLSSTTSEVNGEFILSLTSTYS